MANKDFVAEMARRNTIARLEEEYTAGIANVAKAYGYEVEEDADVAELEELKAELAVKRFNDLNTPRRVS